MAAGRPTDKVTTDKLSQDQLFRWIEFQCRSLEENPPQDLFQRLAKLYIALVKECPWFTKFGQSEIVFSQDQITRLFEFQQELKKVVEAAFPDSDMEYHDVKIKEKRYCMSQVSLLESLVLQLMQNEGRLSRAAEFSRMFVSVISDLIAFLFFPEMTSLKFKDLKQSAIQAAPENVKQDIEMRLAKLFEKTKTQKKSEAKEKDKPKKEKGNTWRLDFSRGRGRDLVLDNFKVKLSDAKAMETYLKKRLFPFYQFLLLASPGDPAHLKIHILYCDHVEKNLVCLSSSESEEIICRAGAEVLRQYARELAVDGSLKGTNIVELLQRLHIEFKSNLPVAKIRETTLMEIANGIYAINCRKYHSPLAVKEEGTIAEMPPMERLAGERKHATPGAGVVVSPSMPSASALAPQASPSPLAAGSLLRAAEPSAEFKRVLDEVKKTLEHNPENKVIADALGQSKYGAALRNAALRGNETLVSLLLECKEVKNEINNHGGADGLSAMHHAARKGHLAVLKVLGEHGGDLTLAAIKGADQTKENHSGKTPGDLLPENKRDEFVEMRKGVVAKR